MIRNWGNIEIEDIKKPQIKEGEALIKVVYAGVCGSDLNVFLGNHPTAILPIVLGHEFSGILEEIKTDLPVDIKPGDKVVAQPLYSCGTCDACLESRDNVCNDLKLSGIHYNGCYAEYLVVPAHKVFKLPDNFDMKLAALTEPLAVAVHDVRRSQLKIGDSVLVLGGGPIGILIALVARLSGAREVVISEVNDYRIKFIEALGLNVINPTSEDFDKSIEALSDNKGFDVVYEVTGNQSALMSMTKLCKVGGTVVLTGMPKEPIPINILEGVMKEHKFVGVRIHSLINFKGAVDLLKKGTINKELNALITNEFSLDEIKDVMEFCFEDDQHFKVIIKI